jgi:hypothetical protein
MTHAVVKLDWVISLGRAYMLLRSFIERCWWGSNPRRSDP